MERDPSRIWKADLDVKQLRLLGQWLLDRPTETWTWVQWPAIATNSWDALAEEPGKEGFKVREITKNAHV